MPLQSKDIPMRMNKIISHLLRGTLERKKSRENFPDQRKAHRGGHGEHTGVNWEKLGLGRVLPERSLNHRENHTLHLSLLSKVNYHFVALSIEQGREYVASHSNTVGLTPVKACRRFLAK